MVAKFFLSKTIFQVVVSYILELVILFRKVHFPVSFNMYHNSMGKIRDRLTVSTVNSCESLKSKKWELRSKSLKASLIMIKSAVFIVLKFVLLLRFGIITTPAYVEMHYIACCISWIGALKHWPIGRHVCHHVPSVFTQYCP